MVDRMKVFSRKLGYPNIYMFYVCKIEVKYKRYKDRKHRTETLCLNTETWLLISNYFFAHID